MIWTYTVSLVQCCIFSVVCVHVFTAYLSILQSYLESFPTAHQCRLGNHMYYHCFHFLILSCPLKPSYNHDGGELEQVYILTKNWGLSTSCPAEVITQGYCPWTAPFGPISHELCSCKRLSWSYEERWFEENKERKGGTKCIVIFFWIMTPCFVFLPLGVLLSKPRPTRLYWPCSLTSKSWHR